MNRNREKKTEIKDSRGRETLKKDESEIDETPAEFLDEAIIPESKWARDKFGDEHFTGGTIDQGKIQLGRKREHQERKEKGQ